MMAIPTRRIMLQMHDPDADRLHGKLRKAKRWRPEWQTATEMLTNLWLTGGSRAARYLKGVAYIKPPLVQSALRPRSSFKGLDLPTLRSKISP